MTTEQAIKLMPHSNPEDRIEMIYHINQAIQKAESGECIAILQTLRSSISGLTKDNEVAFQIGLLIETAELKLRIDLRFYKSKDYAKYVRRILKLKSYRIKNSFWIVVKKRIGFI